MRVILSGELSTADRLELAVQGKDHLVEMPLSLSDGSKHLASAVQKNEVFRLLVDSAKDYAIFVLDPEGHVVTWNAGAQAIKGYVAEEIIGQHFSKFYPHEAVESGWPARELALAKSEGRFEVEGWRVRKDGTRFWASVIIAPSRRSARGFCQGHSRHDRAEDVRGAYSRFEQGAARPRIPARRVRPNPNVGAARTLQTVAAHSARAPSICDDGGRSPVQACLSRRIV